MHVLEFESADGCLNRNVPATTDGVTSITYSGLVNFTNKDPTGPASGNCLINSLVYNEGQPLQEVLGEVTQLEVDNIDQHPYHHHIQPYQIVSLPNDTDALNGLWRVRPSPVTCLTHGMWRFFAWSAPLGSTCGGGLPNFTMGLRTAPFSCWSASISGHSMVIMIGVVFSIVRPEVSNSAACCFGSNFAEEHTTACAACTAAAERGPGA